MEEASNSAYKQQTHHNNMPSLFVVCHQNASEYTKVNSIFPSYFPANFLLISFLILRYSISMSCYFQDLFQAIPLFPGYSHILFLQAGVWEGGLWFCDMNVSVSPWIWHSQVTGLASHDFVWSQLGLSVPRVYLYQPVFQDTKPFNWGRSYQWSTKPSVVTIHHQYQLLWTKMNINYYQPWTLSFTIKSLFTIPYSCRLPCHTWRGRRLALVPPDLGCSMASWSLMAGY